MAGSGEAGLLESPSYVIVGVFVLYTVLALVLEKGIHFTSERLKKFRRKGLLIAMDTVVAEVTMLGFISLMLIAFQENIASICVSKHDANDRWVILSHIDECAPCLENTDTISEEYKAEAHCPFWAKGKKESSEAELKDPGIEVEPEVTEVEAESGRRLLAGGGTSSCGKGEEPLFSVQTLHESHIAIFCLAVVHILNSLLMILIATWKVNVVWGRFDKREVVYDQIVSERVSAYDVEHGLLDSKSTSNGGTSAVESGESSDGQVAIARGMQPLPEQEEISQETNDPKPQDTDAGTGKQPQRPQRSQRSIVAAVRSAISRAKVMMKAEEQETGRAGDEGQAQVEAQAQARAEAEKKTGEKGIFGSLRDAPKLNKWTARERDMKKPVNWLQETFICFFKQFVKPVSREEYRIMKASFMLTHKRTSSFSFRDYVLNSLDDNFAKIMKFSLSGWLALISFILLLPPLGWTTWRYLIFQILAILLLLAVNVKLIKIVRFVTRGGKVHELTPDIFWFKNPFFLVHVIRLMLYLNSVIFAYMAFSLAVRNKVLLLLWPEQGRWVEWEGLVLGRFPAVEYHGIHFHECCESANIQPRAAHGE